MAEENQESHDETDNGSAPEIQDERTDDGDGGNENGVEAPTRESIASELKQEFDQNFRSYQAKSDAKLNAAQVQNDKLMEMLTNNKSEQKTISGEDFKDEFGETKESLGFNDVQKVVREAIANDRKDQQRVYDQQLQDQAKISSDQQDFTDKQKDKDEVLDYYQKNQREVESRLAANGISDNYKAAFLFARAELAEKKLKESKKPNPPPVGNGGANFAGRNKKSHKSPMELALERRRKKTLSNFN